jgi:hypothetical protein
MTITEELTEVLEGEQHVPVDLDLAKITEEKWMTQASVSYGVPYDEYQHVMKQLVDAVNSGAISVKEYTKAWQKLNYQYKLSAWLNSGGFSPTDGLDPKHDVMSLDEWAHLNPKVTVTVHVGGKEFKLPATIQTTKHYPSMLMADVKVTTTTFSMGADHLKKWISEGILQPAV